MSKTGYNRGGFGIGGISVTPSPSVIASPLFPRISPEANSHTGPAVKADVGVGAVSKITGQSFNVAGMNTGDMKRNKETYNTDLQIIAQQAGAQKATVEKTMAAFDKALNGVQEVVAKKFIDVADGMGYDGKGLLRSMAPVSSAETMNAAAQIGAGMAISPAASMVMTALDGVHTALKSGGANQKQIDRVMAEVHSQLVAQQNTAQTMQAVLGGAGGSSPAAHMRFDRVTPQDLQDLFKLSPQNQPERKALAELRDQAEAVLGNNRFVADNQLNEITPDKAAKVIASGNTNDIATVIEALNKKPDIDAGMLALVNSDMSGLRVPSSIAAKLISAENKPAPAFNLEAQLAAAAPRRPDGPGFAFTA